MSWIFCGDVGAFDSGKQLVGLVAGMLLDMPKPRVTGRAINICGRFSRIALRY